MKESKRILKLYFDLYKGNPWTAITLTEILKDINAEQAAKELIPKTNTIWQLVHHCVSWRDNVLQKLQGAIFKSPEDNYLSFLLDTSETAWSLLLLRLRQSELLWEDYLNNLSDNALNETYIPSDGEWTNYEVIHGLLHHDNYHFGQIVILKKLLQVNV